MIELEKKWLLKELPILEDKGLELVKREMFVQTYLGKHERLRAISEEGVDQHIYEHFIKKPTDGGASIEDLKTLTEDEYDNFFKLGKSDILKSRNTYYHKESDLHYEVDMLFFEPPRVYICLLEIEFQHKYKTIDEVDANFKLPDFMKEYLLMDVTGKSAFSNYSLSQPREKEKSREKEKE